MTPEDIIKGLTVQLDPQRQNIFKAEKYLVAAIDYIDRYRPHLIGGDGEFPDEGEVVLLTFKDQPVGCGVLYTYYSRHKEQLLKSSISWARIQPAPRER